MKIPFPCLGGTSCPALVAAAIALIWANGEPTPEAGKTSGVESGGQSNNLAQVSDPARALVHAYTLENRTERESRIRDRALVEISNLRNLATSLQEVR